MKRIGLLIGLLLLFISCDKAKNNLRDGNKYFEKEKYTKAEDSYLKALGEDSLYMKANYNIGNSNYRHNSKSNLEKSLLYYNRALESKFNGDSNSYAQIYYNKGNTNFSLALMDSSAEKSEMEKKLRSAIEDYKMSLKINPDDSAAKYNLSLASYLLKKQEENKKNNKDKKQEQQQQSQPQSAEMKKSDKKDSENRAEMLMESDKNKEGKRMLEALKNNEKRTLDNLKKDKDQKSNRYRTDKDW